MSELAPTQKRSALCAGAIGVWIGLGLLKFGSPPYFAQQIPIPAGLLQFILDPWPFSWAFGIVAIVFLSTIGLWKWVAAGAPRWILSLPGLWFAWQLVSALFTIDFSLSGPALLHFAFVAGAFYIGFAVLPNLSDLRWFWIFFGLGVVLVIAIGLHQHFIGLEETRRYFYAYKLPKYPNGAPPQLLKKIASNRIYSTLFYPNTFAATLILGLPIFLVKTFSISSATRAARLFLVITFSLAGLLCLFWSGSKAGWLIALLMAAVAFLRAQFPRHIKIALIVLVCLAGISGFALRYGSYLQRGATSATARLDYWRAAVRGFTERPIIGSGPGTFMLTYKRLKPPEAEMARLAHNDYLQQACDSGLPGCLMFTTFVFASIALLCRKVAHDRLRFAIWLALFGLSLHGIVEFNLYVPAIAWPQFLLLGWLWAQSSSSESVTPRRDSPQTPRLV
jgi:O-antigen ligase